MTAPEPTGPVARDTPVVARSRLVRAWWMLVGGVCVVVGAIGMVVPGLPTTVFFLAAAWCFARSNPRLEQWILDLPGVGPMVRDARAGLGMPRRAKILATAMIWAAITLSTMALRSRPLVAVAVIALGVVGSAWIWLRIPTKEVATATVTGR